MKKMYLFLILLISIQALAQTFKASKTFLYENDKVVLQNSNHLVESVELKDNGIYTIFYDNQNMPSKNTKTFKWTELQHIGNKYIYQVPNGALYVFEFENEVLKNLYLTLNLLEGGSDSGFERNYRKFRIEF